MTRALITGVTGQDGSYLAEYLAGRGDEVWGMVRGQPSAKWAWVQALVPSLRLVHGDMLDQSSLASVLEQSRPDVVYNLAAVTFVGMSWQQPSVMSEVTGLGALRLLEAVRAAGPGIRVVHASTSEMFGQAPAPQDEETPLRPRSPYGTAKTFAHHTVVSYRESYGMHVSAAIMFNHESPRRGQEFVTRKVSLAAAAIRAGRQRQLRLGRLDTCRDWGWAPDYVRALPLMAARDEPGDFVLATGETHSVAELCEAAFTVAGLDWRDHVASDPSLYRPAEVDVLRGDPSRAGRVLGWSPALRFGQIIQRLTEHDLAGQEAA
jgi:GDPmannose 4,6-dehydratase